MHSLKIATLASALGVATVLSLGQRASADNTNVRWIVDSVAARTTSVSSYSANILLHVKLHSFPFLSMTVKGDTTYQQPGQYTVTMKPSELRTIGGWMWVSAANRCGET